MNSIILTAKSNLIDKGAWEELRRLETKIDTINERTKNHTLDISQLRKQMKGGLKKIWIRKY